MQALSKSKLLALGHCRRRLWLDVHKPAARSPSDGSAALIEAGHRVGEIARALFDPERRGVLVDRSEGQEPAFARTAELLAADNPIFEAGFSAGGTLIFADILAPASPASTGERAWRLIEVKSSGGVKDHYLDDVAVQVFVADAAGVKIDEVSVAHIDTSWVYPGDGEYRGLLIERDVTVQAQEGAARVSAWIEQANVVLAGDMPDVRRGRHCKAPVECGFAQFCAQLDPDPQFPSAWLPRVTSGALKALIEEQGVRDLTQVPDNLLNPIQLRVKQHTLSNAVYFNAVAAAAALKPYGFPAYFLDFETIQFAVPIWAGTKPFQQIPFQFSLHVMPAEDTFEHVDFLDLTGDNPSERLAHALIHACGSQGVIFAYNAAFERGVILALAEQFPTLAAALRGIAGRLVDLLPLAREHFDHPSQKGSWSIKAVLPAIAPDLRYQDLEGVQHGGMAQEAYLEAIRPETAPERRAVLRRQLERYCELDTWAMVRLWQFFTGRMYTASSDQK
jgi:hypothetical protein